MKTIFTLLLTFLVSSLALNAQVIEGKITSEDDGSPVPFALVQVLNFGYSTVSDEEGNFKMATLPNSNIVLLVTSLGFENTYHKIDIQQADTKQVAIRLKTSVLQLHKAVIVSAKRQEQNAFELPESIASLHQTQLLENAPRTTPEALVGTSGIWVQKTNHGGGSAFVRGLTGNQVLLLVDGIRLNNATFRYGPNQYLNTIDPYTLTQIEAIKGGGSVQYGSDAVGGAIQLLTKNPIFSETAHLSGNVLLKYMNLDMEQTGRVELDYSSKKFGVLGGFSYSNFGDIVGGEGIGRQNPSGYQQWAFDVKTRIRLAQNQILTFAHQSLRQSEVHLFHKVTLEDFDLNYFEPQSRHLTYAKWEIAGKSKLLQKISITGFWNLSEEGRISQKNNSTIRREENDKINTLGFHLELLSQFTNRWSATSGIEYYHDQVSSSRNDIDIANNTSSLRRGLYPDDARMGNAAIFSLHTFEVGKLRFSAGARLNLLRIRINEETLGENLIKPEAIVGNAAVQYFFLPHHQLIASLNTTFRSPNVDDMGTLGIVDNRYEIPTFDLKPEKSTNFELGYKTQLKFVAASVAFFRNNLQDLIVRVPSQYNGQPQIDGRQVYRKENVAKAYVQGFEIDTEWQIQKKWLILANFTYLYGQDLNNQEPLRRIPPLNSRIALRYQISKFAWLKAEYLMADAQNRLAAGDIADNRINPDGTPAWQILNFSAGGRWKFIQAQAGLQNIFNQAYRMHGSGVDGYGRSFWISTKLSF